MATGLFAPSKRRVRVIAADQRSQRSLLIQFVVTFLLAACSFRLAQLQLIEGAHHRGMAEQNRISEMPLPSDRGNILDRHGRLLAANRLTRSVYLSPREQTQQQWAETAQLLGKILNMPPEEILARLNQVGYHSAMPVRITRDLSQAAFVSLAEKLGQLPGIDIRGESSRYYPNGKLAAHVLGYIGEATAEELKQRPDYPMGMIVGQMGIERIANQSLEGVWGGQLIEVDAKGRQVKFLGIKPSQSGASLKLTLDLDLQKTAEKALANRRGAVVVLDVQTGAVLALASGPTFDPNLFTRRVTIKDWQQLQAEDKPFLNRALQGYPPGSTFKIVTAAAAMESGKFAPSSTLMTYGAINLGGVSFHEHGGGGYGVIGFPDAFAFSSNTFFYQVGIATGPEEISKWGTRLGIGKVTQLGLDGENHGSIPTPIEKEKLFGEPWYGGDTVTMAIGQGLVQSTPLEMAVMSATVANGGNRVKPHLLSEQTPKLKPEPTGIKPETLAVIQEGLAAVVQRGTGQQLNDGSVPPSAGKTGTAEVPGQPDNALYTGYIPATNPKIAVAVVVENGGYGAVSAVPIAHEIYKTYFKRPAPKQ
jgi:penicillin-binding protein 2